MKVLLAGLASVVVTASVFAQSWPVGSIPAEIKRGADAVIRHAETEFEYLSPTLSKERNVRVVTVLTGDGEGAAYFSDSADKFRSFSDFSGEIYDASGKLLRKIKKSELLHSDYSISAFLDDNRIYYCQPNVPNPPFTVKYEWEITTKNGVWAFPWFLPRPSSSFGVEKAVYRLKAPSDMKFTEKAYNIEPCHESTASDGIQTHIWSVENMPPVFSEPYRKPGWETTPVVYFSPEEFIYDGVAGSMKDWEAYARWQWKLLDRSSDVPQELKTVVADLTKDADDDEEKIRILYDYLGRTTRYVSIQIGIGGFQPMSIGEVYETKYGDCKALSNYLRMMLAECGIESYYAEIGVDRRSIPRDFASPSMSNHAILMVPRASDTLWVECTNPELPLGYRHDGIVGQNALVYKNGTAEVITVPRYADSLNLSERRARVTLNAQGGARAHVSIFNRLHMYDSWRTFDKMKIEERLNTLSSRMNVPMALIFNPVYSEDKGSVPTATVEYDMEAPLFGSRTGGRLFLNTMSFLKPFSVRFGRSARREDICVQEGYLSVDMTEIALPEGVFEIETMPAPVALDGKYGSYSMVCRPVDGGIEIERRFLLRSGTWDKEEFGEFRDFVETVSRYDNSKIVLKNAAE